MALRLLIIGPGRVGCALARQWSRAGVQVLGLVGRSPATTAQRAAALQLPVCALTAIANAHVVAFAVGDDALPAAIAAAAAAAPPRSCSLWLHTSGRHDLDVLLPAGPGIRRGSLHPVAPFPLAAPDSVVQNGAPAVIAGDTRALRLLTRLCQLAGLQAVPFQGGDRVLYHAACALAANGTVALRGLVEQVFAAAGGLPIGAAAELADALQRAALADCRQQGPARALTGPVRRGDAATVQAHLHSLAAGAPAAVAGYLALMQVALQLAAAAGLSPAAQTAVAAALRGQPDRS